MGSTADRIKDIGPQPQSFDIERATKENTNYRSVAWSDHAPCADSRSIGCQGSITPSRFPQLRSLPDLLTSQEHHHPDALSGGSQRVALRPVLHQAGDALRG